MKSFLGALLALTAVSNNFTGSLVIKPSAPRLAPPKRTRKSALSEYEQYRRIIPTRGRRLTGNRATKARRLAGFASM